MKRAITLAGGGPAAGLHIGVLKRLNEAGIKFDVWALSCIGAWVGIVYNQCDGGKEVEQTYNFFHDGVFRDDASYSRFPINSVFGPDIGANTQALMRFFTDPNSYQNLWLPDQMIKAARQSMEMLSDAAKWNEGDFNNWILNQMAANPYARFLSSMMFLSDANGLARIYYPESSFLRAIKFDRLYTVPPFIYHNAWNLSKQRLEQFANKTKDGYGKISAKTLCACSALPYIEEPIEMNGDIYCEGALVDTVNFEKLLNDHEDLDEVWVSRIVDVRQVKPPRNMHDALANLCMLFAGSLGDDDVKLFKFHAEKRGWRGKIVEMKVSTDITFEWTYSNLDRGVQHGYASANEALKSYTPPH